MRYSNQTVRFNGVTCIQVSKVRARKEYRRGKTVYLHPCRMALVNPCQSPMPIKYDDKSWIDFDVMVNGFINYNCVHERGKYPHFFIEK